MNDTFNLKTHTLHLRFFDVAVTVTSDSGQFIGSFGQVFLRFSIDAPQASAGCLIECAVLTDGSNEWGRPVIIVDREVYPIHSPSLLEGYAYERIITAAFIKVRSHLLVHAGVVSRRGEGILLVADAEHGKTTLTLELVKRGFTFLSDEVAALGRIDHRVHPSPGVCGFGVARRNFLGARRSCPGVPYSWASPRSTWRYSGRTSSETP